MSRQFEVDYAEAVEALAAQAGKGLDGVSPTEGSLQVIQYNSGRRVVRVVFDGAAPAPVPVDEEAGGQSIPEAQEDEPVDETTDANDTGYGDINEPEENPVT